MHVLAYLQLHSVHRNRKPFGVDLYRVLAGRQAGYRKLTGCSRGSDTLRTCPSAAESDCRACYGIEVGVRHNSADRAKVALCKQR
jgi:biotin synthase-like enzyme